MVGLAASIVLRQCGDERAVGMKGLAQGWGVRIGGSLQ